MSDFGLTAFKASPLGRKVAPIIESDENVRDMIAFSRGDLPAVRVIGRQLLALGMTTRQEQAKKLIGRWVREEMERRGWTPVRSGKVPRGNLFSTGAIYRKKEKK